MQYFIENTIKTTDFQVEDVANDNACFYRALANCLNYNSKTHDLKQMINKNTYGNTKKIEEVYKNENWGYYGESQDALARELQKKSFEWILNNCDNHVEEFGTTLKDLIVMTHDIDFEEYLERYNYFAGDVVVDKINTGKTDINNEPIYFDEDIGDRWGGLTEQIALSNLLEIPIIILTSQKYDIKRKKVITGKVIKNRPEINVRFKLLQIIGKDYIGNAKPIYLLWKKYNKNGHYMALYCNNSEAVEQILF